MKLSNHQIKDFQDIYYRHFGKELTHDEAGDLGARLLSLMRAVYQPIKKDEYEQEKIQQPLSRPNL